jgi:hypothetical protein
MKKLTQKYIWRRIFYERLTEPMHLNLLSLLVYFFGSYRTKIEFDLIIRQHNAYAISKCAVMAKSLGVRTVSIIEFGVANGAGLMNMAEIAKKITKETGILFKIYGFDTGKGLPPPRDYRDHPEIYREGDCPMDVGTITKSLPENTKLILGDIAETTSEFLSNLSPDEPIGYVVIDVDYYFSTKDVLETFKSSPEKYLPITIVYLDDIHHEPDNSYCGELLAVREFNEEENFRKIEHHPFFENSRIFKRADWIKHIYRLHVLDHPSRFNITKNNRKIIIKNPYLK